jgi:hypothetical protein
MTEFVIPAPRVGPLIEQAFPKLQQDYLHDPLSPRGAKKSALAGRRIDEICGQSAYMAHP